MDRTLIALIACFLLVGCTMTPTQKKWTGIAAGVLIVGAIAAHDDGKPFTGPDVQTPGVDCSINPESCR